MSLAIIKGLDHDDTLALNSIFAADSFISGDTERNVIKVGSSREVSLGSISSLILEAPNNSNSLSMKALDSSALAKALAGGPVFFSTQETMVSAVLPPPYSIGFPFLKNFKVGYPLTSNFSASLPSSVASTLASLIGESFSARIPAALAYSGARALQCPHHGA